jgi:hypothetical protein
VNYNNISEALSFYKKRGYVYAEEAPWVVGKDAYHATKPPGSPDVVIHQGEEKGFFVASGEQSFVQMMIDGSDLKRAMCVTPCFRVEKFNHWHRPYFTKLELINGHDVDEGHLIQMIHDACGFFESMDLEVRIKKTTDTSYDIVEKNSKVELGSYGIRHVTLEQHNEGSCRTRVRLLKWIYGTGCAEPRLSTVIEKTQLEQREVYSR